MVSSQYRTNSSCKDRKEFFFLTSLFLTVLLWIGMSGKHVIGIDLGTTFSCVGVWQDGRVEIIANAQGNRTTPSYVAFTDSERLIGDAAKNQAAMNPTNTVFDAKRLIGRMFNDHTIQADMKNWPFKVVAEANTNKPLIEVKVAGKTRTFKPEEISAMVLSQVLSPHCFGFVRFNCLV
jgi:heat shock protein 1/8